MLPKKGQKRCSFFAHYFLFYAIALAYLVFSSCHGVRTKLIPQRNTIWADIPKDIQLDYLELQQKLDDFAKEELETKVNKIKDPTLLERFIKALEACNKLLELLPRSERTAFKQKFDEALNKDDMDKQLDAQERLIDQCLSALQMILGAAIQTQQHYIDLLEILPEDQATALKDKIVKSTSSDEVEKLIVSKLPKRFNQSDHTSKKKFFELPDHERREILKAAMDHDDTKDGLGMHTEKEQPNGVKPNNKPTGPTIPNNGHSTTSTSNTDINELIKEKFEKKEAKVDDVSKDGWGPRLPLEGEERKEFLTLTLQFSQSDQKYLKELFYKIVPNSIKNFFSVFFAGFNKNERIELLSTMIYLYKGWPDLTLNLCNEPKSFSHFQKLSLFFKVNGKQLDLLRRLDSLLSQL